MARFSLKWLFVGVAGVAAAFALVCLHLYPRQRFARVITPGLSQAEVVRLVGEPEAVLRSGDRLGRWGNVEATQVAADTWVYHPFPASVNRAVVSFERDRVSQVQLQGN
ncbi:MAG: hypothetical protein U0836_01420 [Pirellulales bacterium]